MEQRVFYVYYLRDGANGVFYIGKGMKFEKYNRVDFHLKYWKHHQSVNRHLYNKIKQLNGEFVVDVVFEGGEMECLQLERQKIAEHRELGVKLCNITDGGEGVSGIKHTKETKLILSDHMKNPDRICTSKTNIKKAQEQNKGKRRADEYPIIEMYESMTIQQIATITGLSFPTIKSYLQDRGVYTHCKNKKLSVDHKEAIKHTMKTRMERKKVNQYDLQGNLLKTWAHQKEAADVYGGCVGDCLRGRQKTAYGYIWKYDEKAL